MKRTVVLINDGIPYGIDVDGDDKVEKLSVYKPFQFYDRLLITFQVDELLHAIKTEDALFPEIIDFECLDHEIRQSITPIENSWHWSVQSMLDFYLGIDSEQWENSDQDTLLPLLKQCYLNMIERGTTEIDRIQKIELPLNKILYKTQKLGIYFDVSRARDECEKLYNREYELKNDIQLRYGITVPDYMSFARKFNLPKHELSREELKYYSQTYPELKDFLELKKATRNYDALLVVAANNQANAKCYPSYKGFGSSTGRIFLKEPSLQNLRRCYRPLLNDPLVSQSEFYKYAYFDYSQFEAGIIAGLTNNDRLKKLYNEGRIYDELGRVANVDRDTAKTYFYCFAYGGIAIKGAEAFFDIYCSKSVLDQAIDGFKKMGYVETKLGNRRIIGKTEESPKWLLNHLIQGTSSLIFKQAIIDTNALLDKDEHLLIPMHDGALYILRKDTDTKIIARVYADAFRKWIPNMDPIVKEKNFFED